MNNADPVFVVMHFACVVFSPAVACLSIVAICDSAHFASLILLACSLMSAWMSAQYLDLAKELW